MATRSRIGIEHEDGKITSIYCHWDGYPEHHLPILEGHYFDREKVAKLIELGDLSVLGEEVDPTGPHSFDRPQGGVCVAYGRDRGEKGTDAQSYRDVDDFAEFEYNYLFTKEGKWKLIQG